jgi:hypothetical protein
VLTLLQLLLPRVQLKSWHNEAASLLCLPPSMQLPLLLFHHQHHCKQLSHALTAPADTRSLCLLLSLLPPERAKTTVLSYLLPFLPQGQDMQPHSIMKYSAQPQQ